MDMEFNTIEELDEFDRVAGALMRERIRKLNQTDYNLNNLIKRHDSLIYLLEIINGEHKYFYIGQSYMADAFEGIRIFDDGTIDFYDIQAFKKHFNENSFLRRLLNKVQEGEAVAIFYSHCLSYFPYDRNEDLLYTIKSNIKDIWQSEHPNHKIINYNDSIIFDERNKKLLKGE